MSNSGKNKSIRKENFYNQKIGAVGFESIEFYHKASAGDTTINLASLVTPSTELAGEGFSQPSPSVLIGAGIFNKRSSLSLESTLKPKMMDRIAYTIRDNSTIVLKDVAEEGEIFHGIIHNVTKNLINLPETQTTVATGTLAEGANTFAVGANFRTNINPTEQLGEVHVYRNGVLMFRNVSNAVAAEGEDGNYEEVPIGNGFSNEIKFNLDGDVGGEAIHIVSPTRIIKDDGTLLQQVQNISGVVDIIREDLINEFQFPPNRYDGFSSDIDLKAFNNRVLNLEKILNLNIQTTSVETYRADTIAGHGTTNTKIPYFTNVEDNTTGQLVEVTNDATIDGGGWKVVGLIDCDINIGGSTTASGAANTGLSLNSGQLTTNFDIITQADKLSQATSGAGGYANHSGYNGPLKVGQTIRLHDDGTITQGYRGMVTFTATAVISNKIKDLI